MVIYLLCLFCQGISLYLFLVLLLALMMYLLLGHRLPTFYLVGLCLFGLWMYGQIPAVQSEPPLDTSVTTTVSGQITSYVEKRDTFLRFTLYTNQEEKVQLTYFLSESDLPALTNTLKTGANCSFAGKYQTIPTARNPGQFDYQFYLASQDIHQQFIIESLENSSCMGQGPIQKIYDLRDRILQHAERELHSFTYAWFAALLFGDRSSLEEEVVDVFQDWNLTHIIAISGLHVGLIVGLLYFILVYVCRMTVEKSQLVLIAILLIYPIMAGGTPSVWRACLMMNVILVTNKLPIRLTLSDTLSLVCILLLLYNPHLIYSLAFQFSFTVTFAIILSRQVLSHTSHNIWNMLQISFLSLMIILPIQLYHFYQFQPSSVLINLLVIPYFSIFVLPLLFILLLGLPFPFLLTIIDMVFWKVHSFIIHAMTILDERISFLWLTGEFPLILVGIYYVLLYVCLVAWEGNEMKKAFRSAVLIVFLLVAVSIKPYLDPHGYVTVLDIGQGDAIVIELPYRKGVLMIDAAGTMSRDFQTPSAETFEQIIQPFFQARGIQQIDAIILSHADHDHIGSVPFILNDYQVDHLFSSPFFDQKLLEQYREISPKTTDHQIKAGDQVDVQGQLLEVLYPWEENSDKNENSVVLKTSLGQHTWLFTGDIGKKSEAQILEQFPSLHLDVLKVAHHGSNTSSAASFLRETGADIGIISAGLDNQYGHPHPDVLTNLKQQSMDIYRTDTSGAITYQYTKESVTIFPFLP